MEFEIAILKLKSGKKIYRKGWLGPGQFVYLREIDEKPSLWICKMHPQEEHWPWSPTQREFFRDDWEIRDDSI